MRGQIALGIMLILGITVLSYSVSTGVMIGAEWFGVNASFPWHMNNYIVMEAKYAYSIFGLATLAIGGLATGLAMAAFFSVTKTTKHMLVLVASFFVSIVMTGLGFNTLDFMLGSFYWTNMQYPPPVHVALIGPVDVWNFYFFFFVAPLWAGGLILGLAASYYSFGYRPKHAAAAYIAKKNFGAMLKTAKPKEYIAESAIFSRNRRISQQPFDNTN